MPSLDMNELNSRKLFGFGCCFLEMESVCKIIQLMISQMPSFVLICRNECSTGLELFASHIKTSVSALIKRASKIFYL